MNPRKTTLALAPTRIDIWQASLDFPENWRSLLESLLDSDECSRADAYHFDKDRRAFVARRGLLKILLGLYGDHPPAQIALTYSPFGKPSLAGSGLPHFNLSRSENLVLIGFTLAGELGIDLEKIRPIQEMDALAARLVPDPAVFLSLPEDEKQFLFHRCWTRMEAFLKASGEGLGWLEQTPADRLIPGRVRSPEGTGEWILIDLPAPPGFAASLCCTASSPAPVIEILEWCWFENASLDLKALAGGIVRPV